MCKIYVCTLIRVSQQIVFLRPLLLYYQKCKINPYVMWSEFIKYRHTTNLPDGIPFLYRNTTSKMMLICRANTQILRYEGPKSQNVYILYYQMRTNNVTFRFLTGREYSYIYSILYQYMPYNIYPPTPQITLYTSPWRRGQIIE